MPDRERFWDQCDHCKGSTRCDCGNCRVFFGHGYETWAKGPCFKCGAAGGEWRYRDTGELVDATVRTITITDDRRR